MIENTNYSGKSFGRYHLLDRLGEGGMATVYKAFDTHLESEVAVKLIRNRKQTPETLRKTLKRFEREARALVKLSHTNIVKIIDYGEFEGQPFLVMPYFRGGTLKDLMRGKPIHYQEAARLLSPIAQALSYAHQAKIIHRDIKPANILIDETGNPMLTDFGIAKILDEEMPLNLTGTSSVVGTPEYMAPEQVSNHSVDHRVDIYALGVVFYEMVTGRKPFQADTPVAVLFKHVSDPLPRPSSFVSNLPEEVEYFLFKALAKRPEDRYQDMAEFNKGLQKLLKPLSRWKFLPRKKTHKIYNQQPVSSGAELTYDQLESSINKNSIPIKHRMSTRFWIGVSGILGVLLLLVFLNNQGKALSVGEITSTITPTMTKTIAPTQEFTPTISSTLITTAPATMTTIPTPSVEYKISFVSDRDGNEEIYIMDIDGSNLINLSNNDGNDSYPAFSPDGKRIAFASDRDWNDDIYLMDSDGSKIIRLTDSSVNDQEPAWSPDGKQIAFTSGNDDPKIYKMNADGSQQVGFSSQGSYGAHSPSWSPDGSEIAFSSGWNSINFISPEGKTLGNNFNGQHPSWSPDGSKLVYDGGNSIFTISPDQSDRVRITFSNEDASEPVWSPDGKWIAFTSLKDDNKDIYITSLDGKNLIRVTDNPANDYSPAWVP
jgi:Tol biopolymer transport system component/tRNA A-37 threonylcarbamoyl transferase component Bud32